MLVAFILTAPIAKAQTGWITHKGDERVSVKFPAEPREAIPGTFIATDKDSTGYVFTIVDFVKIAGIDSVALAPMKDTQEFADQLKVGMVQSLPNVVFDDFKIGKWKGFTHYTSTGYSSEQKRKYYLFMFIIGSKLYNASAVIPDGVGIKGRDDFWASIVVK